MRPIVILAGALVVGASITGVAARQQPASPAAEPQGDGIVVVGPRIEDDIVVTGDRPTIRGGLWRFRRSGTMNYGAVSGRFSGGGGG